MPKSKIPILSASDDIQDPKKYWYSTTSFRRFRNKHNELSRLHWTSALGAHFIDVENGKLQSGERLTTKAQPLPFKGSAMPLTKEELASWLPDYQDSIRNAVLPLCSGNLELYMKRVTRFHLAVSGYACASDRFTLTPVGQAVGEPVLKKSTIHLQLKYLQDLLGIDFKKHLGVWVKAYKERCNLAHQAGVISHSDSDDLQYYGENIVTEWPSLLQLLDSTNQIVGVIDQTVSTPKFRLHELEFELVTLKAAGKLPPKKGLWQYVHSTLGCRQPSTAEKKQIEASLY